MSHFEIFALMHPFCPFCHSRQSRLWTGTGLFCGALDCYRTEKPAVDQDGNQVRASEGLPANLMGDLLRMRAAPVPPPGSGMSSTLAGVMDEDVYA